MYKIIGYSDADSGIKEYVVDTVAEMWELPGAMGSTALVLENMNFYIKDGEGNWRAMA